MIGRPLKSAIKLLQPKPVPRSVNSRSSPPDARTFSTTLTMSRGATNCPFFTLTGRPLNVKRSEEHTSELQSHLNLVCRLLLHSKKIDWNYWRYLDPDGVSRMH